MELTENQLKTKLILTLVIKKTFGFVYFLFYLKVSSHNTHFRILQ
jgi:hypothetical protein